MLRKPGPLCGLLLGHKWIDTGTLALTRHNPPGPIGRFTHDPQVKMQDLTDEVAVPSRVNIGLSAPSERFMLSLMGRPRKNFFDNCQPVTSKSLASFMEEVQIGKLRVEGLRPAVQCLKIILKQIESTHPIIYKSLGTAGMLCCRKQRGSTRISNHSWGTAIDLTVCGKLDDWNNGKVQRALALIAPIFNRNGWVWGATYRKEDGMHFEVSKEMLLKWKTQGALPKKDEPVSEEDIERGDYGDPVRELQLMLNKSGAKLLVDGNFGALTEIEVKKFQLSRGLISNGIVGVETQRALREAGREEK